MIPEQETKTEYTDRLRVVGWEYVFINLLIIFGGGTVISLFFRQIFIHNSFREIFLCMSLMTAIFWLAFNINAGNPKSVFYRVISRTIKENAEKYGFEDAETYKGYMATILIDKEEGQIAYISNLNPFYFQMISAASIGKIAADYVPYMSSAFTTYVYFRFHYHKKRIRIPTYATSGNGRSLADKDVERGFADAEKGAESLRIAKHAALMNEGRKRFDPDTILPEAMWTMQLPGEKHVITDIVSFEKSVKKALYDIKDGREKVLSLIPQEPVFGMESVQISASADSGYLYVTSGQTFSGDRLTVMDALNICIELFINIDPRKDG